jgi:hypothetical protein
MATKTIPLRYRLAPSYLDRLKEYAAARRWSTAFAAQAIIEEVLDGAVRPQMMPTTVPARPSRAMSVDTDVPLLLGIIKEEIERNGRTADDGSRVVLLKGVENAFYDARPDRKKPSNRSCYFAAMKILVETRQVFRGNGWVWFPTHAGPNAGDAT